MYRVILIFGFKYVIIQLFILLHTDITLSAQPLSNQELKDSIENILIKKEIPGGIITVVSKDSTLFSAALGYNNINESLRIENESLFKIASLTKTITAMAIMRMVKEGELSLDDELKAIAPEIPFHNKWSDTHPIKIKHLIEHKSGFSDYSTGALAMKYSQPKHSTTIEDILSCKSSLISNWKPGIVTSYSNPGYEILGYIIEKKSGTTYQNYIAEKILGPLKMFSTMHIEDIDNVSLLTQGYTRTNGIITEINESNITNAKGATGLLSNISDMTNFLQYLLSERNDEANLILGKDGIQKMETSHCMYDVNNKIQTGYNMALEDRVFGEKNFLFKGNSGLTAGFVSNFIYSRDLDIGVFISTNLFLKSNQAIIELVINNFCSSKENLKKYKVVNTDYKRFADWEGEHRELNDTQEIWNFINFPVRTKSIKVDSNSITISDIENGSYRYKNVGDNAFISEEYDESIPTLYLTEYEGDKSIRYYESTYSSTNRTAYLVLRIILILSLAISSISIVVFIIMLGGFIIKKCSVSQLVLSFSNVLPFLILTASIYLGLSNLSFASISILGKKTFTSVGIFILTLIYPFVSVCMIYSSINKRHKIYGFLNNLYNYLNLFATATICIYCITMGWFAVRFWV